MVEIQLDACYLIIRFWDFSLDFTERVTYSYLCNKLSLQSIHSLVHRISHYMQNGCLAVMYGQE